MLNFRFLTTNRPLRYTLLVTGAGLMCTLMTWYSAVRWNNYVQQTKDTEQLESTILGQLNHVKTRLEVSASDPKLRTRLAAVKNELQSIYDGTTTYRSLSDPDAGTQVMLMKAIGDANAFLDMAEDADLINADELKATFAMTYSSVQGLMIHYGELSKDLQVFAFEFSRATVLLILFATLAVSFGVYRFFSSLFEGQDKAEATRKEDTARVEKLTRFIEAMSSGKYDIQLTGDQDDELNTKLATMRDELMLNAKEVERRNWATAGMAQIGEILRSTSGDASVLYNAIINFVVKYTKSNQGGLFLYDEEQSKDTLQLEACYAFERKKFLKKTVDLGQGLLGQCFLEKERIYLTELPEDYMRITSGLGGDNPNACLMVPLKVNDQVFGVMELASFQPYQEYEIELVEKFAETIAATISNVKINESTRILLERTQQQAEQMKAQEEEMRQNMEELSATQEEMQRKEQEYISRIQQLEERAAMAESE